MLTNKENVPIPLAVWLAFDTYDFIPASNSQRQISATSLLKPLRMILLERSITGKQTADVMDNLAAVYGSTLHAGIEAAWKSENLMDTLLNIGIPFSTAVNIRVNPETVKPGDIPVYLEQRNSRSMMIHKGMNKGYSWTVSGKFDIVINGHLYDNKSTSTWTYVYGSRVDDYKKQCSIYKWLNPDTITDDTFSINYIFTDWSKQDSIIKKDKGYPQSRLIEKQYEFLDDKEIEKLIRDKLQLIEEYSTDEGNPILDWVEKDLRCPDDELWRGPVKYKYYSDVSKINGRSTRTFDDRTEAYSYMNQKGKGTIIEAKGEPRRCRYCSCWDICKQRMEYFSDGIEFLQS